MDTLNQSVVSLLSKRLLNFPNLHEAKTLFVGSDYSGQHKGSTHETLAFLITDYDGYMSQNDIRCRIRKFILRDNRRMSFKALNDKRKQRALYPILNASNQIPGLLVTISIDKSIDSIFDPIDTNDAKFDFLRAWSPYRLEKSLRIMHFASFFIAGLSSTGQNVVWFTDEDEFVPDNVAVTNATTLFGHISSHYLGEQLGHLRFGTTECDDGSRMIEDFVAIPDLAAGMITEYLDKSKKDNTIPTSRILRPITNTLSQKSKALFTWFGDDTKPLKRAALRLWGENNSFSRFGWIMFHGTTDDDQIEWEFKKLQTPLKAQP